MGKKDILRLYGMSEVEMLFKRKIESMKDVKKRIIKIQRKIEKGKEG